MNSSVNSTVPSVQNTGKFGAQQFGLWLSMASLIMLFGAFTSAYIVRQAAGNWLEFSIPNTFLFSTIIIILSSVALQIAYNSFKKSNEQLYKTALVISFVLGLGFVITQYFGWVNLYDSGVDFKINPSASFFYLITWVHAAHVIAAITIFIITLINAFAKKFYISKKRRSGLLMIVQFWHFLGILWIYLYAFLLFIR